jgi:hypothetical protein
MFPVNRTHQKWCYTSGVLFPSSVVMKVSLYLAYCQHFTSDGKLTYFSLFLSKIKTRVLMILPNVLCVFFKPLFVTVKCGSLERINDASYLVVAENCDL